MKDIPYEQEFSEKYLEGEKINCLCFYRNFLIIGTDSKILKYERNKFSEFGNLEERIFSLFCFKNTLFAGSENGLYTVNDRIEKIHAGEKVLSISSNKREEIFFATEKNIYKISDKKIKIFKSFDVEIREINFDRDENLWVATRNGVYKYSKGNWIHFKVKVGCNLTSNDVRCVVPDSAGFLWIGTSRGITIYDGKEFYRITVFQGIPYLDIKKISIKETGELWCATNFGAMKLDRGRWHYYQSRRWLCSDNVNCILPDKDCVWLGTEKGLSKIGVKMMTLEEKAEIFLKRLRERHCRYGFVSSSYLEEPENLSTWIQEASDNDGTWTSIYVAAESFRYAVTKSKEAKKFARESLYALLMLEEKTPIEGFIARSIVKKGERVIKSHGEWHTTPDGKWEWKGDTSSDEIDAHMFAYSIYYDLVADEKDKKRIRKTVRKVMDYLMKNNYNLIDIDGEHTTWAVFSPEFLNSETWQAQRGLNSLQILSHLKCAYHITGDKKYQDAYLELIKNHHYALNTIDQRLTDKIVMVHHDDELAFFAYYPLLKYEEDPNLRRIYLMSLERTWKYVRNKKCPFFNFIYGYLTGHECDIEEGVKTLREIPLDLVCYTVKNSQRVDLKLDPVRNISGKLELAEVLPIKERRVSKWDGNPFEIDGGADGKAEDDGAFFLFPYWMGRYFGYIEKRG